MKRRSIRGKATRLQVEVTEALALGLGLNVEAQPPTKVGTRMNGVVYVPQGHGGGLRSRRMGEPGADIVLLTTAARLKVALPVSLDDPSVGSLPCWIECKNTEAWNLGMIWKEGGPALVADALTQSSMSADREGVEAYPVVAVSCNRAPTVVAFNPGKVWRIVLEALYQVGNGPFALTQTGLTVMRLDVFVRLVKGWRMVLRDRGREAPF